MHIKRKTMPKFWPIQRTGTKYLAVATHEKRNSMPAIIVVRDLLKLVKNQKEMQMLINEKKIEINGKVIRNMRYPLMLFDCLTFPSIKKHYRVGLKNKKFALEEIKEAESRQKIHKVEGKKIISGKKVQINLSGGKNLLTPEKINVGDFIVLSNDNKILKIITLKKDSEIIVIKGKHIGKEGKIKNITKAGEDTMATIEGKEGELKININNIFAKA